MLQSDAIKSMTELVNIVFPNTSAVCIPKSVVIGIEDHADCNLNETLLSES